MDIGTRLKNFWVGLRHGSNILLAQTRIFQITRLDEAIPSFDSEAQAVASTR